MNTPAPRRVGNSWLFADGSRLPIVSGGDGPAERPEVPADLGDLSVEQLAALSVSLSAWAQTESDERTIAALTEAVADHARLQAEMNGRTPEPEPSPTLAELAAQITPLAAPPAPEPAASAGDPEPTPLQSAQGFSLEQLTAAVAAGVQAAIPAPVQLEGAEGITAAAGRVFPALSLLKGARRVAAEEFEAIRPPSVITASADVPGFSVGDEIQGGIDALADAIVSRRERIGRVPHDSASEFITVGQATMEWPEDRLLKASDPQGNSRKIAAVQPLALLASGGSCPPVTPHYEIMQQSGAHRPVQAALAGFGLDDPRGGVSVMPALDFSAPGPQTRAVADGVTTGGSPTITSATASFLGADWGDIGGDVKALVSGPGIPAGAYVVQVVDAATVVLSANATATAAGVALTIVRKGAVDYITEAQDAAALGGSAAQLILARKPFMHVTCPGPITAKSAAISMGLEFGNFGDRAFPEQRPAWIRATLAQWARVAETALLDKMSAASTQATAASVVGGLRTLAAHFVKAVEYYRYRSRLDDNIPIHIQTPHWVRAMAICDLIIGSGYEAEFLSMAEQMVDTALATVNATISYYVDSGTGKGQLFAPGGVQGAKQGAGALVAFPSTAVSYIYAPGSHLYVGGRTIDFGLWRDSGLNARNNFRYMVEGFETLVSPGYEMLELTSSISASGTFAGPAYGSTTAAAPVAIPASF